MKWPRAVRLCMCIGQGPKARRVAVSQSSCGGTRDTRCSHRFASGTRQGRPSSQGAAGTSPSNRLQGGRGGVGEGACQRTDTQTLQERLSAPATLAAPQPPSAPAHLSGSSDTPHTPSDQASRRGKSSGPRASRRAGAPSSKCSRCCGPLPASPQAANTASTNAGCCGTSASACCSAALHAGGALCHAACTCAQASCSSVTSENRPSCCAASLQAGGQRASAAGFS